MILNVSIEFCESLADYNSDLSQILAYLKSIRGHLSSLIHPLSHYTPDNPIYREEMIEVDTAVSGLIHILPIDFSSTCLVPILEKDDVIILNLEGKTGWKYTYELKLDNMLYCYLSSDNQRKLSHVRCHVQRMTGKDENNKTLKPFSVNKSSKQYSKFCYNDISTFIDRTIDYVELQGYNDILNKDSIRESLQYVVQCDEQNIICSLNDLINEKSKDFYLYDS